MKTEYDYIFREEQAKVQIPSGRADLFQMVLLAAVMILVTITAFLLGVMYERRTNPANSTEMASFWQAWDIIEENYYGELPDEDARKYGAIQGLVASLNDPFTSFAPPAQAEVRRQQIDGHFGGIGVTIAPNEQNQIVVAAVLPGNPGEKAGLLPGDVFMEVDGMPTTGWSQDMLVQAVRGEIGTSVNLRMYRPGDDSTYDVSVQRAIIETPTVSSENRDGIGYIYLSSFNGVATSQLETHLRALLDEDVRAIILDLRGNGGGLLDQAVSVADLFLDEGLVLTERSQNGEQQTFRSDSGDMGEQIPMVVLTDSGTASASEVVAGALRDRGRATLIGQNTFGKGVVQLVYNLIDGSQLRVTSAAWYTPSGEAIHQLGLKPDVVVEIPLDYIPDPEDPLDNPFIQTGIDYLNERYPAEDE